MMTFNDGETLAATWWQASFTVLFNGDAQPIGNSPGKVGLWVGNNNFPMDPMNDPGDPGWVDMAPISWRLALTSSTTNVWWGYADLGPIGRKAKAMRKVDATYGMWIDWHIWGNGTPAGWNTNLEVNVQADAYISNIS